MIFKKRKIFATIPLLLSLVFGKPQLRFSESSSPNFGNQELHQRLIDERYFYSFEDNDQQVNLAKSEGNPVTPPTNRGLSNFPTPPAAGRPKVGAVELLNSMISVLFQKRNNHKNPKLLIMIIGQKRKSNPLNNVSWKKNYGGFPYKLDKSGNPILRVETKAGSEILLT